MKGWATHRQPVRVALKGTDALPSAGYRQPVVLVCGDGQAGLFGDSPDLPRVTRQGCYVPVPELEHLPVVVAELRAIRPDWSGQLCTLFVVNPGEHRDTASLAGRVRAFGHQLALARRHSQALPVLLASYVPAAGGAGPWFCWEAGLGSVMVHHGASRVGLDAWQRQAVDRAGLAARLQASVRLNSAAAWLLEQVMGHLDPSCVPPVACTVTLVSATPGQQSGNVWQQWLCERTGLVQAGAGELEGAGPLPFPDAVVQQLPLSVRRPAAQRAAILATWTLTVAGLVAFGGSAWHNHWLARQVFEAPRHVVASVQPEPAQPATEVLRLDSLSLFPSGSAQLKSGAIQVLVRALIDIKARPGELIVVAGHTDATGQADSNLRLSRARAEAVRDWMRTMGGIPDSCFAVQGLGASQPIASNDTEQGRAANRRVDIRLVPEVGACGGLTLEPSQPPAPPVAAN